MQHPDHPAATRRLAEFAVQTTRAEIGVDVAGSAKLAILDTIGVALAALQFPIGRIVRDHAEATAGGSAAGVLGTDIVTSPVAAAQANGTLAHALDYDDHGHLSTHVLPAALAVGELTAASGAQVLEAYVVGRECGCRLSSIIEAKRKRGLGPTYRGWYRVGVVGPVAAAIAAGKVLGLDAATMTRAIAIACSSSAGLRRNLGTMTKALHAGNAAASGVTAALLAARGFTADDQMVEGELGLVGAICRPGEAEWAPLDRLGAPFELAGGVKAKRFPSCSPSHVPIAAVLQLREKHDLDPDAIVAIEADRHEFSLRRPVPDEAIATGYSLPYLLAIALVDGRVGLDQVNDHRLGDERVRRLMAKVVHDPNAAASGSPERVTVRLADGTRLSERVDGKPDLRDAESITAKFADCAGQTLDPAGAVRLRDAVLGLEAVDRIGELLAATRPS